MKRRESYAADLKETFSERVIRAALAIPFGRVATYGQIARAAGGGAIAARSVTSILGKAWLAGEKKIPFHRIVYADGKIWTSPEHHAKRMRLYKKEGIEVDKSGRIEHFRDIVFQY
jgi:methylated-DNA-protein-cysteine methyltransferase-like protein